MANYSSDTELRKIDSDIEQWLGSRSDFSDVRDLVTARINEAIRRAGVWARLDALGVLTSAGDMVDKAKLLNASDIEDIENTWVREVLYYDNITSADVRDAVFTKACALRRERMRMLAMLELHVDTNDDGSAEEIIYIGSLKRG